VAGPANKAGHSKRGKGAEKAPLILPRVVTDTVSKRGERQASSGSKQKKKREVAGGSEEKKIMWNAEFSVSLGR